MTMRSASKQRSAADAVRPARCRRVPGIFRSMMRERRTARRRVRRTQRSSASAASADARRRASPADATLALQDRRGWSRCRRRPARAGRQAARRSGTGARARRSGRARRVNQKREPLPGVLSTPISPPISSTSWLRDREAEAGAAVAARGRAVGLGERLEDASARSASMPMPVSRTAKRSSVASAPTSAARRSIDDLAARR